MGRSVLLASAAVAMVRFCNVGYSQTATAPTSIVRFDDIAGKWTGHANNHSVSLEIDTIGRFTARYALGGESGEARLAGGTLVVPLAESAILGMRQLDLAAILMARWHPGSGMIRYRSQRKNSADFEASESTATLSQNRRNHATRPRPRA